MFRILKVLPQYLLPQHMLSSLMYRLTRVTFPPFKDLFIHTFIRLFGVNMDIALQPDIHRFRDFNEFFTRALKPDTRPVDHRSDVVVSPVDGRISQLGRIRDGRLLQAKGRQFTATELLGGNAGTADRFKDGAFITFYLAPPDYHRIHMPVAGALASMTVIPGRLFSVCATTTKSVDRLFARNERIVNLFSTDCGDMALVMVGAILVGSMETVWAGEITPLRERVQSNRYYGQDQTVIRLEKGQEMGRFNMGSTVILLFEKGRVQWPDDLRPGDRVKMGKAIGRIVRGEE